MIPATCLSPRPPPFRRTSPPASTLSPFDLSTRRIDVSDDHAYAQQGSMDVAGHVQRSTPRQRITAVCVLGVAVRLALFASDAANVLQNRPELSTPLTSWRSLQEGVYIHSKGDDPYAGGVFYHSPAYLWLFRYVFPTTPKFTAALWLLADLLTATSILRIWTSRSSARSAPTRAPIVLACYLLNPYATASCIARSTTSLDNAVLITAIASAAEGSVLLAGAFLAVATHLSLYPILLLSPLVMVAQQLSSSKPSWLVLGSFAATFGSITGVAWSALGTNWVYRTWGTILTVSDLTPNVGMWWYFFTEMFDHFRSFFLGVFQLHNLVYMLPVTLRLKHDPLVAVLVLVGVQSTWKSYPALGDIALWGGLLSCFPEIVSELRHPLFTMSVYLYTTILLPLLHSLWLLTGTGNANFFYAATMVHGLNCSLAVVDVLAASLKGTFRREASKELGLPGGEEGWKEWAKRQWVVVQFTSTKQ